MAHPEQLHQARPAGDRGRIERRPADGRDDEQRPDLFGAILCRAPLLDMLRYDKMSEGSRWVTEYGSAQDPQQFAYLPNYSPYHNVKQGASYPPILFVTGDSGTRVDPAHARKMTATSIRTCRRMWISSVSSPRVLQFDSEVTSRAGTFRPFGAIGWHNVSSHVYTTCIGFGAER